MKKSLLFGAVALFALFAWMTSIKKSEALKQEQHLIVAEKMPASSAAAPTKKSSRSAKEKKPIFESTPRSLLRSAAVEQTNIHTRIEMPSVEQPRKQEVPRYDFRADAYFADQIQPREQYTQKPQVDGMLLAGISIGGKKGMQRGHFMEGTPAVYFGM